MDRIASALGDSARWRLVELLAERPRSVGELAELTGLRQPQATKHLQTLAREGVVTVFPLGQRRVYALEAEPLRAFGTRLLELADRVDAQAGERDVIARYRSAIASDSVVAQRDRWADGRSFAFDRVLPVAPDAVWRHWTEPELLATWWAPAPMAVADAVLEPRPDGRVVLEYRDPEGNRYRSAGRVRTADAPAHLVFDLSVLDAAGEVSFTGHYDLTLAADPGGTRLRLDLSITETTVEALPYIAGVETGWGQVLDNLAAVLSGARSSNSKEVQS
ncbi:metalloregulator ArsR/SmtB family transcription factor [Nocardia sp. NBC_00511]|uniref:metalloregulator ArsR/SmtB family transcription factor n=1 Tax=Nocardia sp. NBC_00511 TaxID=2903591 RepID=UPI0030E4B689